MIKQLISNLSPEKRLHRCSVPILGLTGGIASGKTTVSMILKEQGINVINADELVKEIYQTEEAKNFVRANIPTAIEGEVINFPQLRQAVFESEELQAIVEKFIYAQLPKKFLERTKNCSWVVYDVPLLFEKELNEMVDSILLISAEREIQKERLIKRDNSSADLADKILDLQWPLEQKKILSHHIIDNNGEIEELRSKVLHFLDLNDYFIS